MAAVIFRLFPLLNDETFHSARENDWSWQLLPAQRARSRSLLFFPATLLLVQQEELQEQGANFFQSYSKEKYPASFVRSVPLCLRYCTSGRIQDIFERLIYYQLIYFSFCEE